MRKKLALSAVSLLFTLVFAEAALRIAGIGAAGRGSPWFAGGNHPRYLFQSDPAAGYTLRPGFRGREVAQAHEFDVPVAIDARGLREQPHTAAPRPVILAVGDSMTFGEGVPAGGTFSAVIEHETGVRVENGGVPGYSSRQMVERLRHYLPMLRPAMVVMTLSPLWDRQRCATPFAYQDGYIVAASYVGRLELIGGNLYLKETRLPVLGTLTAELKGHSNLMRLALPPLAGAAKKVLLHPKKPALPTVTDYEPTIQAIAEAHRLATAQGARFLALLVDDRGADYARDRAAVEKRLRDLGLPFVAADEMLPAAQWKTLRYPLDTHWNPAGHEAVGKALAPLIGNSGGTQHTVARARDVLAPLQHQNQLARRPLRSAHHSQALVHHRTRGSRAAIRGSCAVTQGFRDAIRGSRDATRRSGNARLGSREAPRGSRDRRVQPSCDNSESPSPENDRHAPRPATARPRLPRRDPLALGAPGRARHLPGRSRSEARSPGSEIEGVHFRELFDRLPKRAPDGDAAIAEVWRLVQEEKAGADPTDGDG